MRHDDVEMMGFKNRNIFFVGANFYCPHALDDGNQRFRVMEKTLEFSPTVLPTLSPYPRAAEPIRQTRQ